MNILTSWWILGPLVVLGVAAAIWFSKPRRKPRPQGRRRKPRVGRQLGLGLLEDAMGRAEKHGSDEGGAA